MGTSACRFPMGIFPRARYRGRDLIYHPLVVKPWKNQRILLFFVFFGGANGHVGLYIYILHHITLLETLTASLHLKMDGWNTCFLLGWPIFRGYLSCREGVYMYTLNRCPL